MTDKILFVDDEPAILDSIQRMLHREFEVHTALGGEEGLAAIEEHGPYSVVISDMRMPDMSGAKFLAQVRKMAPNSVRMLLTGYADSDAAIEAVNEGNIFRYLSKPCEKDELMKAITMGAERYRLAMAENQLLENTLIGSIKVLVDVLSAASPEAFGRSIRITRSVRHIVAKINLPSPWRFEAAAELSQLGCVTVDPELIQKAYLGIRLSGDDEARYDAHPRSASDLLAHIPGLEAIAWMISQQRTREIPATVPGMSESASKDIVLGAKALKLAVAFDELRMNVASEADAIAHLRTRTNEFERELLDALADSIPLHGCMQLRRVDTSKLEAGMILEQDIRHWNGVLMIAKGQQLTPTTVMKLCNLSRSRLIALEVMALVPA